MNEKLFEGIKNKNVLCFDVFFCLFNFFLKELWELFEIVFCGNIFLR